MVVMAALLLCAMEQQAAVLYSVQDLGTFNGSTRSEARGLNQAAEVWGENFNTDFPYFVWQNGTNRGIAKPAEVSTLSLYGRNDLGQFAGFNSYSIPSRNLAFYGFPLNPRSLNQTNFSPRGINRNGDVVGITSIKVELYAGGPLVSVNRPAVVKGRQLIVLPALPGGNVWVNAEATAINDNGVVVGWSGTSSLGSGSNVTHAFMWDGAMHDLHTLTTRSNSYAVAVNNNNMIVGYRKDGAFSANEPFYWTAASNMVVLSLPGGYGSAQPLGLNNRGDVVGVADSSAVLWTNGTMTDLQTVIPASPSWDLDGAYGINDVGEICGYGKNGGLTKALLLRPTNAPAAQCKIELLDPGDPSQTNALAGTRVTTNTAILNSLSVRRGGITADGASRLLVRVSTTNHGTVTLSLRAAEGATGVTGDRTADGGVGNLVGPGETPFSLTRIDAPTMNTAEGIRAYALYYAPDLFHRTGGGYDDSALFQRVINLQAVFTPNSGTATTQSVAIVIARPPLVVLHGIWSDATQAFGGFITNVLMDEAGVQLFTPNYPNAVAFASNAPVLAARLADARAALREQNFASARVDVFAHSMGGVLSRLHAGRADYNRAENYGRGDINRLVTIDSPHRGAIFADAVKGMFDWLDAHGMVGGHVAISAAMALNGMPPELGAGDDLLTASPAISNMNQRVTHVAAHVIVGDFTLSGDLKNLPQPFGGFYDLLDFIPGVDLSTLFFAPVPDSDVIVSVDSQNAGMTGNTTTTFDHFHSGAPNTVNTITRCLSLYEKPPSHSWYADGFPTGWTPPEPPEPPPPPDNPPGFFEDDYLLYLSAGTDVNSGSTVSASVSEPAGTNFTSVLLLSRGGSLRDTNAPFNFPLPIPLDAVGRYPVTYFATDTAANVWRGTTNLSVTPLAALNYLEASPRRFNFTRLGDQVQISVTGVYSDISRNVTDPSAGTTYFSGDTSVVTVTSNGVMTARGPGEASITVSKSSQNAYVDVVVSPSPAPDLALGMAVVPSNAVAGLPITLTLRVTNVGPQNASAVYLVNPLPAGAEFLSATVSQGAWSFTNGVFAAELGAFAPGATASAALTLAFTSGGSHLDTATVSSLGLDVNDSDNFASALVHVFLLPRLSIHLQNSNAIVSWLTNLTGYDLEQTAVLTPTPAWNPAATNPPVVGGNFEISFPATDATLYFRLHHR